MRDCTHDILIQNTHAAGSDGASSQFLEAGNTKLAHDKNVEWRPQSRCNFVGNGHTATGQPEHNHVVPICIFLELLRE